MNGTDYEKLLKQTLIFGKNLKSIEILQLIFE